MNRDEDDGCDYAKMEKEDEEEKEEEEEEGV